MPECSKCGRELSWLHDYTYVCYHCTKPPPRKDVPLNVSSRVEKLTKCPECGSKVLPVEAVRDMPFPKDDIPPLLSGDKTVTCRVYNEQGKYKRGIYRVTDYTGVYQNAHVNLQRIVTTKVKELSDLGIS